MSAHRTPKPPSSPPSSPPEQCGSSSAADVGAPECRVVFVEPDGQKRPVTVLYGQSLMDAGLAEGIAGLKGQCGGAINCATCLCDIDASQHWLLPKAHPDEVELLSYVDEASKNSRLACQLTGGAHLDGLIATVVVSIVSPDN